MDKKKIIYIGNFAFPFGNASGKRVYGNGKLLRQMGYEVIFIGMNSVEKRNDNFQNTKRMYDGFEYYNFSYPKKAKDWINYKGVFDCFINWIEDKKEDISVIICYGSPRLSVFISKLAKWGKKNKIKIVSDCVDWLETRTGNALFDMAKTVDTYYQKIVANAHVDGVICISSYLDAFYKRLGIRTVVIPPLSDYISKDPKHENSVPQLVYAGSPFRKRVEMKELGALKDRVDKMFEILKIVKENQVDFKLYYYGIDKENYLLAFPNQRDILAFLGDNVEFCGFQDNHLVTQKIKNSDFTLLVRDVKKSTMAGFPTKVSESISYGTPVITTRTSDIGMYLKQDEMVVFIDSLDLQKSAHIIQDVLINRRYKKMKQICSGNTIFYYKKYEKNMVNFLENL